MDGKPQTIYRKKVLDSNRNDSQSSVSRNPNQIRNILKIKRAKSRLSRDALYNLHEMAYDYSFIHEIRTHPELIVHLIDPKMVNIFQNQLSKSLVDRKLTQVISYDTTFNLGD